MEPKQLSKSTDVNKELRKIIKEYRREQGTEKDYQRLHQQQLQLDLF